MRQPWDDRRRGPVRQRTGLHHFVRSWPNPASRPPPPPPARPGAQQSRERLRPLPPGPSGSGRRPRRRLSVGEPTRKSRSTAGRRSCPTPRTREDIAMTDDVYEPPVMIELGDFADLTRGFDIGNQSDVHGYYLAP
ncbi:lasso RiPP family leader peptide-containing protein [Kitasatospora xanthocidica]|uniref:Lasso RiPP family leader peptide-containing protein n=1 Tax=Kitasatospora xanthocidica TaxID=83382 RepID=A0A372ZLB9_9ACTN|nr:lasso RiPP family leader peptide-containing protein [Kitasatospora xanthocidica]